MPSISEKFRLAYFFLPKVARTSLKAALPSALLAGLLCLPAPATADGPSFVVAAGLCLGAAPDLRGVDAALKAQGWTLYPGADAGEFEGGKDGTQVFLSATAPDDGAGCTVMDADVTGPQAEAFLTATLDLHGPGTWTLRDGAAQEWTATLDGHTAVARIDDGLGGGAAITMEVRD